MYVSTYISIYIKADASNNINVPISTYTLLNAPSNGISDIDMHVKPYSDAYIYVHCCTYISSYASANIASTANTYTNLHVDTNTIAYTNADSNTSIIMYVTPYARVRISIYIRVISICYLKFNLIYHSFDNTFRYYGSERIADSGDH